MVPAAKGGARRAIDRFGITPIHHTLCLTERLAPYSASAYERTRRMRMARVYGHESTMQCIATDPDVTLSTPLLCTGFNGGALPAFIRKYAAIWK